MQTSNECPRQNLLCVAWKDCGCSSNRCEKVGSALVCSGKKAIVQNSHARNVSQDTLNGGCIVITPLPV